MSTSSATKLLVWESTPQALRMRNALLLPTDEWDACGFGVALAGRRLTHIVVIYPHDVRQEHIDWVHNVLRLRLVPGGKLETFG